MLDGSRIRRRREVQIHRQKPVFVWNVYRTGKCQQLDRFEWGICLTGIALSLASTVVEMGWFPVKPHDDRPN